MIKIAKRTPRQLWHSTLRKCHRLLKLHPSSYPYLSGDTFRKAADHILDMDTRFNPRAVKKNDAVFVQSRYLKTFFEEYHPQIEQSYVLISHNGDENIDENYLRYIDEKLVHWFAQNCLIEHEKLTPLPIGLENKWYFLHGIPSYFRKAAQREVLKKPKIFCSFTVNTNPAERKPALEELSKHASVEMGTGWPGSLEYIRTLQQYAFVASPPGNGIDCHRTWEALYLRVVPIVKRSPLTEYFASCGLPLLIIEDWKELLRYNASDLALIYEERKPQFETPVLWAPYWLERIRNAGRMTT